MAKPCTIVDALIDLWMSDATLRQWSPYVYDGGTGVSAPPGDQYVTIFDSGAAGDVYASDGGQTGPRTYRVRFYASGKETAVFAERRFRGKINGIRELDTEEGFAVCPRILRGPRPRSRTGTYRPELSFTLTVGENRVPED